MSAMITPYALGQDAYRNNITALCHDQAMLDWLKRHSSGEVGSGIEPMKQWQSGWNAEHEQDLKQQFPELYTLDHRYA